jgi:RNA polymerase sigma-70 factor (ECF subfamily)
VGVEAEINERLRAHDLAGAATIGIRSYGPEIIRYLTAILKNEAAAGDAFSSFCEDLWRGIAEFRGEASFKTWAYKLAWHAALRNLRDPHKRRGRPLVTSDAEALAVEVRATTAAYLKTDAKSELAAIRATLDPEEQTLLILRIDRELPWSEIAIVLEGELTESALRKRFERLKEKIRREAVARGLLPR